MKRHLEELKIEAEDKARELGHSLLPWEVPFYNPTEDMPNLYSNCEGCGLTTWLIPNPEEDGRHIDGVTQWIECPFPKDRR